MFLESLLVTAGAWVLNALSNPAVQKHLVYATMNYVMNKQHVKDDVKRTFPAALYALIKEKKSHALNVGIFGENDLVIRSDYVIDCGDNTIDESIHVGDRIYL